MIAAAPVIGPAEPYSVGALDAETVWLPARARRRAATGTVSGPDKGMQVVERGFECDREWGFVLKCFGYE